MSQGLLLKKKEQHLQHQMLLQQQQQQINQIQHHSFPSPITPSYDKKALASPSSSSSSSCRFDALNGSSTAAAAEVTSSASLYSSPTSSSASTPSSAHSAGSQRHASYGQYHFGDVYGSGGNFLSSSYASAAALGSHHDLTRSSCSALPSPTIYPPTPPPSSTPWLHHAWFGSMEAAGYMKTPKNNPFDN